MIAEAVVLHVKVCQGKRLILADNNCMVSIICEADNRWWWSVIQAREQELRETVTSCLLLKGTSFLYHCVENNKTSL